MPLADVQERMASILEAVIQSFTFVTGQHLTNSRGKRDKLFEALLEALPTPGDDDYGPRLQELEAVLQGKVEDSMTKQKKGYTVP